jgi:hypothetical protein
VVCIERLGCPTTGGALYREKVATLASALQNAESRSEAAEALRGLVDAIVLVPAGNELRIELKGNLAAMAVRGSKCEEVA